MDNANDHLMTQAFSEQRTQPLFISTSSETYNGYQTMVYNMYTALFQCKLSDEFQGKKPLLLELS